MTYGKLSALQPKSPLPFYKMAEVNAVSKDTEEAIRNLRKALWDPAGLPGRPAGTHRALPRGGRFREAQAIAQTFRSSVPAPEAHGAGFAGDIAASQKQWPEAIKAYRTGLERVPAAEILAIKLLAALDASGNKADADRFSASWLKDHPKMPRSAPSWPSSWDGSKIGGRRAAVSNHSRTANPITRQS